MVYYYYCCCVCTHTHTQRSVVRFNFPSNEIIKRCFCARWKVTLNIEQRLWEMAAVSTSCFLFFISCLFFLWSSVWTEKRRSRKTELFVVSFHQTVQNYYSTITITTTTTTNTAVNTTITTMIHSYILPQYYYFTLYITLHYFTFFYYFITCTIIYT